MLLTTFSSYGQVASGRQAELMRNLDQRRETGAPNSEMLEQFMKLLQGGRVVAIGRIGSVRGGTRVSAGRE